MSVRARVVRYRVTPTASRRRLDWLAGSLSETFATPWPMRRVWLSFLFRSLSVQGLLGSPCCPMLPGSLLLSRLSGWRFFCSWSFFCSWLFFYSCSIFLRVSCVCSTRLLIQRACRRPHVECHKVCGRVRPLSDRKSQCCQSVGQSVGRSVGRSVVSRNQSVGKQSVRRKKRMYSGRS
jgi:hypothetical protein